MSQQVLQCPLCNSPFQIAPEWAGQIVACPTCDGQVQIPESAVQPSASESQLPTPAHQSPPSQAPSQPGINEPAVFACPGCAGQFGVTPDMFGSQVSCPHCSIAIMIDAPADSSPIDQTAESQPPQIRRRTRKKTQIEIGEQQSPAEPAPPHTTETVTPVRRKPTPSTSQPGAESPPIDQRPKQIPPPPIQAPQSKAPPTQAPPTPEPTLPQTPSLISQVIAPSTESATTEAPTEAEKAETGQFVSRNVDHLLPPKFELNDPQRPSLRRNLSGANEVFIPSADGGVQRINNRVVSVTHEGEKVQLQSLSDDQRTRRRWIQNAIVFDVCLAILLAVIALLRKTV